MKPPALSTPVQPGPPARRLALGTPLYAVGSCFAELMAERLRRYLFPVVLNPHGIVYNPVSAAEMLHSGWREPELFLHEGQWRSLGHHSQLAQSSRGQALQLMANAERLKAHALESSQWLILTLGTAQCFRLASGGQVVANCHRLPQSLFERRRLSVRECLDVLRAPLWEWLNGDQDRQVLLTVSPVRYLRDGPVENSRGKAALLLACEALEAEHSRIAYFPAYEIVLDELRDYRFFERDLAHPSALAVDIVWHRFAETYLEESALQAVSEMDKLQAALEHRPGPDSDPRALGRKSLQRLARLAQRCPALDLSHWQETFQAMAGEES